MKAEDLLSLPWKHVKDWSALSATDDDERSPYSYVRKADVNNFVDWICEQIAQKTKIPKDEVAEVLKRKNREFYSLEEKLFLHSYSFRKKDEELIELERALIIPRIKNTEDNLSRCIKLFESLSFGEIQLFEQNIYGGKKFNIFDEEDT